VLNVGEAPMIVREIRFGKEDTPLKEGWLTQKVLERLPAVVAPMSATPSIFLDLDASWVAIEVSGDRRFRPVGADLKRLSTGVELERKEGLFVAKLPPRRDA
jgi:hypothetical protein